jgi:hypothetical protein
VLIREATGELSFTYGVVSRVNTGGRERLSFLDLTMHYALVSMIKMYTAKTTRNGIPGNLEFSHSFTFTIHISFQKHCTVQLHVSLFMIQIVSDNFVLRMYTTLHIFYLRSMFILFDVRLKYSAWGKFQEAQRTESYINRKIGLWILRHSIPHAVSQCSLFFLPSS